MEVIAMLFHRLCFTNLIHTRFVLQRGHLYKMAVTEVNKIAYHMFCEASHPRQHFFACSRDSVLNHIRDRLVREDE